MAESPQWSPRQESNLYLALRRHSFYPLNYGEVQPILAAISCASMVLLYH